MYTLAQQQLSKQHHYDFGLRGIVTLTRYAGKRRRQYGNLLDEEVNATSESEKGREGLNVIKVVVRSVHVALSFASSFSYLYTLKFTLRNYTLMKGASLPFTTYIQLYYYVSLYLYQTQSRAHRLVYLSNYLNFPSSLLYIINLFQEAKVKKKTK